MYWGFFLQVWAKILPARITSASTIPLTFSCMVEKTLDVQLAKGTKGT